MDVLMKAIQLIAGLAILVGVHEWGHMFFARRFGMRVEKFFIFIPPAIFSKKIGETEYGIGSIPLGGFVKISGMVDESMDKEQLKLPPQPWEFRSKPAWQRLLVMLGGIIVNIITGVFIFIMLLWHTGENYIPTESLQNGIYADTLAQSFGLQTGDRIIAVNGQKAEDFGQIISSEALLGDNSYYTVMRDGKEMNINIPNDLVGNLSDYKGVFITPQVRFAVDSVLPKSMAEKGGLMRGDSILQIGSKKVVFFRQFQEDLLDVKGKVVRMKIKREGKIQTLNNVEVGKDGRLGFTANTEHLNQNRELSLLQAIPMGTKRAFSVIFDTIKGFKKIGKGQVKATDAISGPLSIGNMFPALFDPLVFWGMCGMLSMVLAFMNLLPIPALDGGHVMFLTYEIITGRKPSDKFMEYAQVVGMVMILSLMVFAFSNDIYKVFIK